MTLYYKKTGLPCEIYGTRSDRTTDITEFLVRGSGKFIWKDAEMFITEEERLRRPYNEFEKYHGVELVAYKIMNNK